MRLTALRSLAGAAALAMTLAACGQKPGVHVEGGVGGQPLAQQPADTGGGAGTGTDTAGGTVTTDPVTGGEVAGGGSAAPADTGGGTTTDSAGGGTVGGGAATGGGGGGGDGSGGGGGGGGGGAAGTGGGETGGGEGSTTPSGQQRQVRGNDRTGVTQDKITLATHAPVTGAAPLPTTSFEKSGDLYWRNLIEARGETVLGRTEVELIFRDDKYDPNSARQVCRELAAEAFTLTGGGGTDQIQACGQFAQVAEVPYFSAGVTEAGLRGNPWYFALSMSYKQQGLLLAQMVESRFPDAKVAAIVTDTPNFDDAVEGWEAGVAESGIDYFRTLRHPKGDTSWYNAFAGELNGAGVDVIYILSSPVDYIRFAQQATQSGYNPQYVGVGISMGLNAVLGSGCGNSPDTQVDNGLFFSPFPGLDWGRQNVPEFFEAGQRFNAPTDDIALALWGTAEGTHKLLQAYGQTYGNDLTREDFRDHVETQTIKSKTFPEVRYSPDNHFGATSVHLLQANCEIEEYETVATFATSF